jgi:hypothetical protein
MGKPITQFCGQCKTRKPIRGFNISRGVCADCKGASKAAKPSRKKGKRGSNEATTPSVPAQSKRGSTRARSGPKSWKCPNCLQRVDVQNWALVEHKNARGSTCRGSGFEPPHRSGDAFDYRVPGSFEGGGRH